MLEWMSVGQSKICIKIQARHTAALFFIFQNAELSVMLMAVN